MSDVCICVDKLGICEAVYGVSDYKSVTFKTDLFYVLKFAFILWLTLDLLST